MREVESIQFEIGATPISEINISTKSRDDIPGLIFVQISNQKDDKKRMNRHVNLTEMQVQSHFYV